MNNKISLLAVDIGNTHTVVGLFQADRIVRTFRFSSRWPMTADECFLLIKHSLTDCGVDLPCDGSAICSVVPQLTGTYAETFERISGNSPVIVTGTLNTGIAIKIHRPEQVGADRIANSVAAHRHYRGDVIVVDLGTATTFDVVSAEGEYLGGVIAAGIFTSAQRLFEKAAMIPRMDITHPDRVIGKSTEEAVQSGIYYGAVAQIDGLVEKIQAEWGKRATIIATGGYAPLIARESRTIKSIDPELTLKGIKVIWELQQV